MKMEEGREERLLALRYGGRVMKEQLKRKWEEMKRVEREERPLNTSDGREVREL